MKKILSIFLALTMLLTLMAFPATAAEPAQIAIADGKTNYEQLDTGHTVKQTYDGNLTGSYYQTKTAIPDAANPDFYLVYDLGKAYNLTHFTYHGGNCHMKTGTIYGSNTGMDADDWVELSTFSSTSFNWTTYIAVDTDLSHTGYYRYVKVAANSFSSAAKPAIREIIFTGVEGTPTEEPDIPDEPETPSNDPKPLKPKTETATKIAVSGIGGNATNPLTDGDLTTYAQVIPGQTYFDGGNIGEAVEYVFDFGKKQAFTEFTVYWSVNRMTSADIYVSNDGINWGEVVYSTGTISYETMTSVSNGSVRKATFTLPDETIGRYFKLVVTGLYSSNAANTGCMFREIEFVGTDYVEPDTPVEPEKDPITLTPAGVSAPANTSGRPFACATDGDDTTFYANNSYYDNVTTVNDQFVFDIGYLGTVDSLDILWGADSWGNTTPNAYKIEVSSDGKTWTQKKSYSGIYDITKGAATDTISGENTVFGITTNSWAVTNQPTQANAYTQGNILEKNLGWTDVRYVRVTVTSVQYRLAMREITIGSIPNEDQIILSKGGQIRLEDTDNNTTAGLRFGASIIKMNTGIEGEYKYSEDAELKFGMFMLPNDMLEGKTLVEYLANGVQQAVDVPARRIYGQDDEFITFTAVLIEIPADQYDTEIVAVPYMLKNGEYTYFDEMTKSYKGVAEMALETTYNPNTITAMADSAEKTALREISYKLQYIQRGYDRPYTEQGERIVAKLKRGMNMQGLDASTWSSWDSHIRTVTSSSTYQNIKNAGFDHVRIPFDLINATDSNGNIDTSKMTTYVDKAVDAAIENGLVVLLDFHGWANIMLTDFDRFVAIWTSVATYYKDKYPEDLIFELVNEPHTAEESDGDGGDLNLTNLVTLQTRTIEAIRAIDPDRFICLATSGWNGIWTLKDKGISSASMFRNTPLMNYQDTIVALHSYTPMEFTHQDMSWAGTGGQTYSWSDNKEAYEAAVRQEMGELVEFVEETGMFAILNEFGCNTGSSVSNADETAYANTVVSCIKDNDRIAYTWWEYEQAFGMTSNGSWKTHILNEIMAD